MSLPATTTILIILKILYYSNNHFISWKGWLFAPWYLHCKLKFFPTAQRVATEVWDPRWRRCWNLGTGALVPPHPWGWLKDPQKSAWETFTSKCEIETTKTVAKVHEQSYIATVMSYAGCLGKHETRPGCPKRKLRSRSSATSNYLQQSALLLIVACNLLLNSFSLI